MNVKSKMTVESSTLIRFRVGDESDEVFIEVKRKGEISRAWSIGAYGLGVILSVLHGMSEDGTFWEGESDSMLIRHSGSRYIISHSSLGTIAEFGNAESLVAMYGIEGICVRVMESK